MASINDVVDLWFGNRRIEDDVSADTGETKTVLGVAQSDSADGTVTVWLSDNTAEGINDTDEDNGTYVELPTTASVKDGDEVIVTLMGGSYGKSPVVTGIVGEGDRQDAQIAEAKTIADEAQAVADAVNQHFWTDTNGIHVTDETQESFLQQPTGANILENAHGVLLRDAETNLASFTPAGVAFYDGQGNLDGNITASFGSDGAVIGKQGDSRVVIDNDSVDVLDANGARLASFGRLRAGNPSLTIGDSGLISVLRQTDTQRESLFIEQLGDGSNPADIIVTAGARLFLTAVSEIKLYGGDYAISNPDKFLAALGLSVASTTTIADIASEPAGPVAEFTITAATYTSWGKVGMLALTVKTVNALTANTNYTIATVKSGKRPVQVATCTTGTTAVQGHLQIAANGVVTFRPSAAVAANGNIYLRSTYILA